MINYKFSCVSKCNCLIVYSEIPLGRASFSRAFRYVGKQCGSIDSFLYDAPYITEGFFKNLSKLLINIFMCQDS